MQASSGVTGFEEFEAEESEAEESDAHAALLVRVDAPVPVKFSSFLRASAVKMVSSVKTGRQGSSPHSSLGMDGTPSHFLVQRPYEVEA